MNPRKTQFTISPRQTDAYPAVAAQGTLTFLGQPSPNDTVTLNDGTHSAVMFTFKASGTGTGDVVIGSDAPATVAALRDKINGYGATLTLSAVADGLVLTLANTVAGLAGVQTITKSCTNLTVTSSMANGRVALSNVIGIIRPIIPCLSPVSALIENFGSKDFTLTMWSSVDNDSPTTYTAMNFTHAGSSVASLVVKPGAAAPVQFAIAVAATQAYPYYLFCATELTAFGCLSLSNFYGELAQFPCVL